MPIELSPDDIETIIREADAAAQRLRRRLCLPICEREDLGQDLLVDLLRRLPAYDPARGSVGAFANIVLRNQSSRIASRHHLQRCAQGGPLLSLEVPLAGTREPVGATLTEEDGLAAWHGQTCCATAYVELHHALRAALARLGPENLRFCTALAHRPVTALAGEGFGSRSALYRRLAELRHVLTAHGLGPAWDDLAVV
jgi:DNA-directed RNA polymerase specialized sigma24 family protein